MCSCPSEVRKMNTREKIEELLEALEYGTITTTQMAEVGLHRSILQEFVKNGEFYRCLDVGVYMYKVSTRGIFSTSCSTGMGAVSTRTIPPSIYFAIQDRTSVAKKSLVTWLSRE